MIEINWRNEDRSPNASDYFSNHRRGTFLGYWANYLNEGSSTTYLDVVHWGGLGMVCASYLEDIPEEKRKKLYLLLLKQYLATDRVKHWTDEERIKALQIAAEP